MNQGKLEVVRQEMARVNIDILGISELKWTGMCEFNSDDHYIYYCGQESLRRNGVAIIGNKRVLNAVLGCNIKNRMISVHFQSKPFNITIIQVYAPVRSWSSTVLWRPTRPSSTNTQKKISISLQGDWNAKVGSQEIPRVIGKFGLGEKQKAKEKRKDIPIWMQSSKEYPGEKIKPSSVINAKK